MREAFIIACGVALTAVIGCHSGGDSAQGVAERFIDEHYIRMNLPAARDYCIGVAREKVDEEARLVAGHVIDASTRKPRVSYQLKDKPRDDADGVSFLFEGSVSVDGAGEFTRQWLVNTRKDTDGSWKVSNFTEFE